MIVNLSKAAELLGTTKQNLSHKVNGKKSGMVGVFQHNGKKYTFEKVSPRNVIVFIPEKE